MDSTIAIYGIAFISVLLIGALNVFENDFSRKPRDNGRNDTKLH
jgi:hypothetical protein